MPVVERTSHRVFCSQYSKTFYWSHGNSNLKYFQSGDHRHWHRFNGTGEEDSNQLKAWEREANAGLSSNTHCGTPASCYFLSHSLLTGSDYLRTNPTQLPLNSRLLMIVSIRTLRRYGYAWKYCCLLFTGITLIYVYRNMKIWLGVKERKVRSLERIQIDSDSD